MKISIAYKCIGAAAFLILASLSSVIGFSASQSQNPQDDSPLFAVRTLRSTNQPMPMTIHRDYLGKGKNVNIFPTSQLPFQSQFDIVLKILIDNPSLAKKLFERISDSPQMSDILSTYGLRGSEVEQCISQMMDNPEILRAQLRDIDGHLRIGELPEPSELSTTSIIGCFVVILALLPLAVVIGIVVATLTVVTCLNIGGCADEIIKAILTGIVQELTEP